ncbi:MAG: LytTR family DNA-binding domain-containing protein [Bacillota bacterium]|nr:LytTR family DNA-binding domain-containing protein [Bacillota bacterium]
MLNIAILDDNEKILHIYETLIDNISQKNKLKINVVCSTNNPEKFIRSVKDGNVNVCILDMSISENANGLTVAQHIREKLGNHSIEIIYITGYAQFMQDAFRVKPAAYLIKPVCQEQLEKEIKRLYKDFDLSNKKKEDFVIIKTNATTYKFILSEIIYIELYGSKVVVHTIFNDAQIDISLCSVINQLDGKRFIQSHRSIYVNIDFVIKVDFKKKEIDLRTGQTCYLSRKFKDNWKDFYNEGFLSKETT